MLAGYIPAIDGDGETFISESAKEPIVSHVGR
jgi:hypothetical protein